MMKKNAEKKFRLGRGLIGALFSGLTCAVLFASLLFQGCDQRDGTGGKSGKETDNDRPANMDGKRTAELRAEFAEIAQRIEDSKNVYLGRGQVRELEKELADPATDENRRVLLHGQLSYEELRLGDLEKATHHMNQVFSLVKRFGQQPTAMMHRLRVMVELRRAEISNCISRHHRECCIFPLAGGGVHAEKEPARRVMESLHVVIADQPDFLEAQWLLNVCSMAAGTYPEGVPERFRVPPGSLKSEHDLGRFIDVAPKLGLDAFNLCGGAAAEDFDNDGFLDIITTTSDPRGAATYYHNCGDGTFEDQTEKSGLSVQLGGLNCLAADYDNDGDMDLLVLRGAWMAEQGRVRNSLLRNEGPAQPGDSSIFFTDVTHQAGLADPAYPTQAAVWGDFDNDGDLDLFIGNEYADASNPFPSQLFRNNGDGTFSDVARAAGVENKLFAKGVTAGDYDNDGDLDLYLSNVGRNRLYRNDTPGESGAAMKFTDVAGELGVEAPLERSFAPWFFDFNNDGWLDLFVVAYDATTANLFRDYRGEAHGSTAPCLYLNRGGRFENVAISSGLDHAWLPMGANFGDIDYDGFLDVYLATGDPNYESLMPNVMLRNDAGKRFQNVTTAGGFGHLQKGHGICFADFDHDGDQDLYHQLGGFYPGDKFHNALFLNPGDGGHYLVLELQGTRSNRSAVGARIAVTVKAGDGSSRTIHRSAGTVSSFGGSPIRRQEIGLGGASAIEKISVTWPGSKEPVIYDSAGVSIDSAVRIIEGNPGVEKLERKKVRFDSED